MLVLTSVNTQIIGSNAPGTREASRSLSIQSVYMHFASAGRGDPRGCGEPVGTRRHRHAARIHGRSPPLEWLVYAMDPPSGSGDRGRYTESYVRP